MSYLVVSVLEKKKELKGESKGGLDPRKREKKKKRERGIFLISRDKDAWRGVFFAFFPKPQPHLTHRERERKEEEKKEEEEEKIKVFDFKIN